MALIIGRVFMTVNAFEFDILIGKDETVKVTKG